MKKIFHLFLLLLFSGGAVFAQKNSEGPLTWEIIDGVLIISGNGAMPNYDFASQRPSWYDYKTSLTSITIEEGVTSIGNNAFYGSSIQSVTFSGSTLKTIGDGAFQSCVNLKSVVIPDGVIQIIGYSFYGCKELTSFFIGKDVSYIGPYVFTDCISLPAIEVAAGNDYFTSENGILFSKDKKIFRQYPIAKQGNSYTIPDGVTTISYDAFGGCTGLSSVIIPKTVTTINDWAFGDCSNLKSVVIPNGVTYVGECVFTRCVNLTSLSFPATITSIRKGTIIGCNNLSEFFIFGPPPQLLTDAFVSATLSGCTLRVPAASIAEYEKVSEWNVFKNIVAIETGFAFEVDKNMSLFTGAKGTIKATADNLMLMNTTWKSSRPEVATVNYNGTVTAISQGTTDVTATVSGREAICTVTVFETGKSTIKGIVKNATTDNVTVNLYIKMEEPGYTKKGIIGGYVLLASTVPNDNGEYSFEDLPEGSYQVQVEMDEFEPEATDALSLSGDETLADVDFLIDEEVGKIIVIADIPTGTVETLRATSLQIYPNPFTDVVHIVGAYSNTPVHVINSAGAIVHTQTIANPDETIHLGHLPAGLYIIRLENNGMVKTEKIIKIQ